MSGEFATLPILQVRGEGESALICSDSPDLQSPDQTLQGKYLDRPTLPDTNPFKRDFSRDFSWEFQLF